LLLDQPSEGSAGEKAGRQDGDRAESGNRQSTAPAFGSNRLKMAGLAHDPPALNMLSPSDKLQLGRSVLWLSTLTPLDGTGLSVYRTTLIYRCSDFCESSLTSLRRPTYKPRPARGASAIWAPLFDK
jgi:hypothetical protein